MLLNLTLLKEILENLQTGLISFNAVGQAGGSHTNGRSDRRGRHLTPSGRREAVARTVGRSGSAATRPLRAGWRRRTVSRSGSAATRPRRAGRRQSHERSIQLKQTISPKTALTRTTNVSKENIYPTMSFVLFIICCVMYCLLCITVLCCTNNQMQIFSTKFNFFS